jgi:hypothetical protein
LAFWYRQAITGPRQQPADLPGRSTRRRNRRAGRMLAQLCHAITNLRIAAAIAELLHFRKEFGRGGASFTPAAIQGAALTNAFLVDTNLSDADLSDADLRGADLKGVGLTNTYFRGADLGGTRLVCARFDGADLRSVRFRAADLTGADLTGADLRDADLSGADLTGTNLQARQLYGVRIDVPVRGEPIWPEIEAAAWTALQDEARSPATSADRLVELATHWPGYQMRHLLVANPNIPQEQVLILAPRFPRAFLTNPVLPLWFVTDPNWLPPRVAQVVLEQVQCEPGWPALATQYATLVALLKRCASLRE